MAAEAGIARNIPEPAPLATAHSGPNVNRPAETAQTRRAGARPAVTVRRLIHAGAVTVAPDTTMASAAAAMVRARTGSVVVIQASFLAGILTKWDVLRATASGADPQMSLVCEWMTPNPLAVSPDTPADDAIRIMLENGIHHLPVVEGKQARGVVRLRDLYAARIHRASAAG